jgi:crossover junction endodeoxyribonuclease RusA
MINHLHLQQLNIALPLPTSTNSAYRNVRGRGRVKTQRANEWTRKAILSLTKQGLVGWKLPPMRPPYRATLELYFETRRKSDIANREKLPIDLLVSMGLIEDDSLIDEMIIRRMGLDKANPRIEITIETMAVL